MISDDQLLQKAVRGDRSALDALLKQHGPAVHRQIAGQIDSRWKHLLSEEDVLQQMALDAVVFIQEFEPRGMKAFVAWLVNLARRNLVDAVRELGAAKRGGDRVQVTGGMRVPDESYADLLERICGTVTSPSQTAMATETRLAQENALQGIPETYSRAIRLYDLAGQPAEEVARACNCSLGAMHMRRTRGLAILRKLLRSQSCFRDP